MRIIIFLCFLLLTKVAAHAADYDIVVSKDGSGQYKTIREAIDAAPMGRTTPFKIFVKAGTYTEQLRIPATKPFLEIIGEDVATTTIAYGDGRVGTTTLSILANDCMLMNITLENTHGRVSDGPQSLAVSTNGDRIVFVNCRFISGQDTVLINKPATRVYISNCYIDGNTDFIYGYAIGIFDRCVIYCRDRVDASKGGYLTAAATPEGQAYGFVFRDCSIPDNHGVTRYTLGRPWGNSGPVQAQGRKRSATKVVFLNTRMSNSITPVGWSVWDDGTKTDAVFYAEYKSKKFDGSLVDISKRVDWSKQVSDADAKIYYNNAAIFGDWDPFAVWKDLPQKATTNSLAIANLSTRYTDNNALLQFNNCWPQKGVTYTLYKSTDKVAFKESAHFTAKSDTTIAMQFTERLPAENQTWYYQVKATKGKAMVASDTISVNLANRPQPKTAVKKQ